MGARASFALGSGFAAALFIAAHLTAAVGQEQPCCGIITTDGQRLAKVLDSTGVDHLWPAGWHVDWKTGAV
ncbi:MAG TPA: hypothetical protein VE993_00040, partial [Stellaceae bacterium]|nr:hypothetical protein [Stellaceae bacterium]